MSHKHEKFFKKVLGERDFSILEITKTIKDFGPSSLNIFKNTTENDESYLLLINPFKMNADSLHAKSVESLKNIIAERLNHWLQNMFSLTF